MKIILVALALLVMCGCATPYIPYNIKGDCVDRAVVIRQSLRAQGYEARIILGMTSRKTGHAWVEYKDKKTGEWLVIRNYKKWQP